MIHQSSLIKTDIHAYLKQHEEKSILRFLTCGSVDDGKSTLIGRLLHDSKMIYKDQLVALAEASKTLGSQGGNLDLALLVDGLQAEREQGITIDVAYRYFSTEKRKFIIADTPGHEQYTRNMVTGASNCDAAVILIDARPGHGVLPQTKRHSFIAAMLNIKHVLVAINKMDAVGYSQNRFEDIKRTYLDFANHLSMNDLHFIPISALKGDNIVTASANMPWFQGGTLLYWLENIHVGSDRNHLDFRFPVQYVNRSSPEFRGYAGTIASGAIQVGDRVLALPSWKTSEITDILTFEGSQEQARTAEAVTLTLRDEIDISRGDVLVKHGNVPELKDRFDAMLVWMSDTPALPGQQYLFKMNNRQIVGAVTDIRHKVDINTFEHQRTRSLTLNEIAQVSITLTQPAVLDSYRQNRNTGRFIVIDRISNLTIGGGMVLSNDTRDTRDIWESEPKTTRRDTHHDSMVNAAERAVLLGHKAVTLVFSGLNGSGKTVIAARVERLLFDRGVLATIVDGQHMRLGLCRDLGFTEADRSENLRRGSELARHLNDSGVIALCCFVAPHEAPRQHARDTIGDDRFIMVYLDAPVEVCRQRDEHGLYEAAERGEIADFPGISSEYEPPEKADLILPTHELDVETCAAMVLSLLEKKEVIPAAD